MSRWRGHVFLVVPVLLLAPVQRIVRVVPLSGMVAVDPLCQEVQVCTRWPM